ncbi:unnamed protein product [Toxocara canis]|uniref:Zinc finger CCCH domain-containing protein 6 n=1 Tax=Toxocara canis TaxID=6265 RepID=A0A183UDK9_TOXCA|nr:unnamed protein product [Toxocara canis]
MTSPSEFEKISTAMDTNNEDERKSEEEEEEEEADAEEMEEGEIFDDEDNKGNTLSCTKKTNGFISEDDSMVLNTPAVSSTGVSQSPSQVAQARKPRDFDREEAGTRGSEGSLLSSWMSGVKQRTKPTAGLSSPTIDANEEYYGYGSTSPTEGATDKDYRLRSAEHTDKDYRWGSVHDDESHHGQNQDSINEFGDSDYRSISPRMDRRRRRSPSPGYGGGKRPRGHSPPMRGGYRGRGFRGRWGERQICKFFREGYCRDGENCSYSHDAADSGRKPELCKFYQQGFCKKGLQCPLLHGEYPCKAFHKGECSKDPCQFSHMMKDDELASRIAIPQGPLKRRVLIPGGPSPNAPGASPVPTVAAGVASDAMSGGVLPPPSVVVPTLSTGSVAVAITQPQLVIPPALSVPHPNYPAFFPHHVLPTPGVVDPTAVVGGAATVVPGLSMPPTVENAVVTSQFPIVAAKETKEEEEEGETPFSINKMLEQITSKVKKDDSEALTESPASPPMFSAETDALDAPTIPHANLIAWKLIAIDDIPAPHSSIDPAVLQQSLTDSSLRNDPRIKKALSSQFDAFTNSLMKSAPQPQPQAAQATAAKDEQTSSAKPMDPRTAVNRDPRKRSIVTDPRNALPTDPRTTLPVDPRSSLPTDPRNALSTDPRLAAATVSKVHEVLKALDQVTNGTMAGLYGSQIASTSASGDQLYASTLGQGLSRDHDHRTSPQRYRSPPSQYRPSSPQYQDERAASIETRRGSASVGWMPQIHSTNDPRFSRRGREYGSPAYRSNYGSRDRDEREVNSTGASESGALPSSGNTESTVANASPGPISLREKRKNNEYESPLSRVPNASTRWP